MPSLMTQPDRLFDRLWRPGHPFRHRYSGGRRWGMLFCLAALASIIGSYGWITDPTRVRQMAEAYLSELVGGPVHVGQASLSIFEGLTLSRVTVKVREANTPDAVLLYADSFDIEYNPASLLRGRLAATRIVATGPKVFLIENADAGHWNYEEIGHGGRKRPPGGGKAEPQIAFPEVVLRDAEIQYSEIRNGRFASRGTMSIEGRLSPSRDHSYYTFGVQSRGAMEGIGPVVSGRVQLSDGQVDATLTNFHFGRDIEAMLPSQVRRWWQAHQLEGNLNIPQFQYRPANRNRAAEFQLQTQLDHVRLMVPLRELANAATTARLARQKTSFTLLRDAGMDIGGQLTQIETFSEPASIPVEDVSGTYFFDDHGITFSNVAGRLGGNGLTLNGRIEGYTPDAPFHLHVESQPGQVVSVPANIPYADSLPDAARQVYDTVHPTGAGTLWLQIDRNPGQPARVAGEIDVLDASFTHKFFPYPVAHAAGTILFDRDPQTRKGRVRLEGVHGVGVAGGPNESSPISINGWISPLDPSAGCDIQVVAENITNEPRLFHALSAEVRHAIGQAWVHPASNDEDWFPQMHGKVSCEITVPVGIGTKAKLATDILFDDISGRLSAFPYPMRHLAGAVEIRDGRLEIPHAQMEHEGATMAVSGRVTWNTAAHDESEFNVRPDIQLLARNVPVDQDLLEALPSDQRQWVQKAGITGRLDASGRIFIDRPTAGSSIAAAPALNYDLEVQLHDGSALPIGNVLSITDVSGQFHLTPDHIELRNLKARRGDGELYASGNVNGMDGRPIAAMIAGAKNLSLDDAFYKLLPPTAAQIWDAINPHGMLDAQLTYTGDVGGLLDYSGKDAATTVPSAATATTPATPPSKVDPGRYTLSLHPRDLSIMPKAIPYQLDHCTGAVNVTPEGITLTDITGTHGGAKVELSGKGLAGPRTAWDLALSARAIPIDADLIKALPGGFANVVDQTHLRGKLSLALSSLRYRDNGGPQPDVDASGTLSIDSGSMEAAVPMSDLDGAMSFSASVRDGQMDALRGNVAIDQLTLSDRPVHNLKAQIDKPSGEDSLHIDKIEGELAGGLFAGSVNLAFPDDKPASYSLDIALKNADIRTVTGETQDIRGQLSASLAMQGQWSDDSTRRGRGDAMVTGRQMYQIPLLLGLWQVTNLSLPATTPFNQGTTHYSVDGKRITFEQIQMRSDSLAMNGNGWMDFGSRQVRMNFTTDNTMLPKLPFIHDIWQGAKQELMQIQIRGTIQEPKVSAAAFHTFTTTVDQVLTGRPE